jgi:predicted aconitase
VLSSEERHIAAGGEGPAAAMAMRIVAEAARLLGASTLLPIASAHIDGCLYHGDAGVAFAERLVAGGGRVVVPSSLNVGALDLLHHRGGHLPPARQAMARCLMEAYLELGCQPTWTCAPYQAGHRPAFGSDVAWGESNAVAFANSVLGARTNRYGDFLDIACALVGRAPATGLHLPSNRVATVVIDTASLSTDLKDSDAFYPVLGAWYGAAIGNAIGVIDGLPPGLGEDRLKALGAAAASTGAVALFHVAGSTPEAPTVAAATAGVPPVGTIRLTAEAIREARDRLSTVTAPSPIDAVAVGSPHFSAGEFDALARLLTGRKLSVPFYACTGRHTLAELERTDRLGSLTAAGITLIADTCVVVTPILPPSGGVLMTNSGKFAHYTPGTIGYGVVYGSLADCVASAEAGRIVRDERSWR